MAARAGNRGPHQNGVHDLLIGQAGMISHVAIAIVQRALAAELAIPDLRLRLEVAKRAEGRQLDTFRGRLARSARKGSTTSRCRATRGSSSCSMCVRLRPVNSSSFINRNASELRRPGQRKPQNQSRSHEKLRAIAPAPSATCTPPCADLRGGRRRGCRAPAPRTRKQ